MPLYLSNYLDCRLEATYWEAQGVSKSKLLLFLLLLSRSFPSFYGFSFSYFLFFFLSQYHYKSMHHGGLGEGGYNIFGDAFRTSFIQRSRWNLFKDWNSYLQKIVSHIHILKFFCGCFSSWFPSFLADLVKYLDFFMKLAFALVW